MCIGIFHLRFVIINIILNHYIIFSVGGGGGLSRVLTCMHLADAFIQSDLQAIHFFVSMCTCDLQG